MADKTRASCPRTLKRVCGYKQATTVVTASSAATPSTASTAVTASQASATNLSFNNACLACRNPDVVSYTLGACQ